ncbi:MAG: VOC family protein, partial [bacterium]|nr:VOC family protein [bacterium]
MSHIEKHDPGEFCWGELATTDPAAAKQFYASLFGWAADDQPIGEGKFYTMLKLEGRNVGALYEQMEQQRTQGVPPHWMLYVS